MSAYDLEEQEQIDALKAWWNQHGNLVQLGLAAVLLSIAGYFAWGRYQASQSGKASQGYERVLKAAEAKDPKLAREAAGELLQQFGSTAYASLAALVSAKVNFDAADPKNARAQLQWAVTNAKDAALVSLARLRLAAVLLEEKDYSGALDALDTVPSNAFAARFADQRGDVYVAQGKSKEAAAAYAKALETIDEKRDRTYRQLVQIKLDALVNFQ